MLLLSALALSKAELRIYQDLATSPLSQDDLFREPVSREMIKYFANRKMHAWACSQWKAPKHNHS